LQEESLPKLDWRRLSRQGLLVVSGSDGLSRLGRWATLSGPEVWSQPVALAVRWRTL
jgi:hypothetical protein